MTNNESISPIGEERAELQATSVNEQHTQAEVVIDGQVYQKTVLPAFTREDAIKGDRNLSLTGLLGSKPSSSIGSENVEQTRRVMDSETGEIVSEMTTASHVSLGAKRPGAPGDINSRKSGL